MAGNSSDSAIASAPTNPQALTDQIALSQNVQSLAFSQAQSSPASERNAGQIAGQTSARDLQLAPTSKWDKFVDITEQGVKDIPLGIEHTLENPLGLLENAAVSVAFGTAAKVLMPEAGPLGSLFAVGLGAYFAGKAAVPVYEAYKTGMDARTMAGIDQRPPAR